jgi:hypothetical protein
MDCDWWSLGVIMYEVSCVCIRETFKWSLVPAVVLCVAAVGN